MHVILMWGLVLLAYSIPHLLYNRRRRLLIIIIIMIPLFVLSSNMDAWHQVFSSEKKIENSHFTRERGLEMMDDLNSSTWKWAIYGGGTGPPDASSAWILKSEAVLFHVNINVGSMAKSNNQYEISQLIWFWI